VVGGFFAGFLLFGSLVAIMTFAMRRVFIEILAKGRAKNRGMSFLAVVLVVSKFVWVGVALFLMIHAAQLPPLGIFLGALTALVLSCGYFIKNSATNYF
jgi:hypothetical protein